DAGKSRNDYPKGYILELSADGKNWQELKKADGKNALTEINIKPTSAKFIKITMTKKKPGLYWSIHNMDIFAK
ncbi:MAG: discoidin domain-containing protein, partial [Lentisphaeraceae bacterium]|nr:discoidin domain-containing protein [Lentisphaeraceae bacterium]